jgi:hypothetical protein
VSPIEAAREAIEHTRRHLFPFGFSRWLTLGFVAFLDQCGRGGSTFNVPTGGGGDRSGELERAVQWVSAHVGLVAVIAAVALTLIVAVMAVVLWLNSRGVFVYLDDVVTGRAEVSRPWREHAQRARSYFAWSFGLSLATLVAVVSILAAGGMVLVGVWRGRSLGVGAVFAVVTLGLALLVVVVIVNLLALALRDFAAPIQMCRSVPCGEAMRLVRDLVKLAPGPIALYVLLKIVFAVTLGLALILAACATCCCALLPVVTQTLLQPLFYFERAWSVCLLRMMGYDLLGGGSSDEQSAVSRQQEEETSPPADH